MPHELIEYNNLRDGIIFKPDLKSITILNYETPIRRKKKEL